MENDFISYSIKSAVIFSLLFLPYYLMRRDTLFVRNRFYLLLTLVLSLVLPLLSLNFEQNKSNLSLVLSTISLEAKISDYSPTLEFLPLLTKLSLALSLLFLLRFFISLTNIILMILRNPTERRGNETIVWMDGQADFSFFHYIFLSHKNYHPNIHQHERIHVQRLHSVDIILFELFRCFQWYNPLVWLALAEIKSQHEFEADELTAGLNKNEYQALLLSSVLERDLVHMTNSFYYLSIKERFNMMNKKRSPKRAWTKTLAVLPLLLLSVGLFANIRQPDEGKAVEAQQIERAKPDTVYPEFQGGHEALVRFLTSNIVYPEKAKKEKITGRVEVKFTIDKDGNVRNAKIKQGINAELDQEALRVINAMPAWKAGSVNGKAVAVELFLPISFKLD